MRKFLEENKLILMEAAIVEQLRRSGGTRLHDALANATLIYEDEGRQALCKLYQDYIEVASKSALPFIMCTPTWRANHHRVSSSGVSPSINIDAAGFMRNLRDTPANNKTVIKIGGMIGCRNDCYRPDEGLGAEESEKFHSWQLSQLKKGGVDFLIAETLPGVEEAIGIAKAMEYTGLPYIISFVIDRNGAVLDGTRLSDAVRQIDSVTERSPVGYMVNCSYPTFLNVDHQPAELFSRLIGFQANASSLDHCDLDNAVDLEYDNVSEWGEAMLALSRTYNIGILGGCCGTGVEHLQYIANHYSADNLVC